MEILCEYNNLKIPTWALSYIVNADDSGIDEEEKQMVDDYLEKFENYAEGYHYIFGIETNQEYFDEAEQILIDEIEEVLSGDWMFDDFCPKLLEDVLYWQERKHEWKEPYFSWNPSIGSLGGDVQECTILICK